MLFEAYLPQATLTDKAPKPTDNVPTGLDVPFSFTKCSRGTPVPGVECMKPYFVSGNGGIGRPAS